MAGLLGRNHRAANNRSTTNKRSSGNTNSIRGVGSGCNAAELERGCYTVSYGTHLECQCKRAKPKVPKRGGGMTGGISPRGRAMARSGRTAARPAPRGRKMAYGGLTIDACPPHLVPDGRPCNGDSVCCSRDCREGTCYGGKDFRGAKRGGRKSMYGRGSNVKNTNSIRGNAPGCSTEQHQQGCYTIFGQNQTRQCQCPSAPKPQPKQRGGRMGGRVKPKAKPRVSRNNSRRNR